MEQPKLLDLVRNMIRTKHYSLRTEEAYVGWIKRFILFHGKRHPKESGKKEISAFLTHLAVNRMDFHRQFVKFVKNWDLPVRPVCTGFWEFWKKKGISGPLPGKSDHGGP